MPASFRLQRKPRALQRRGPSSLFWDLSIVLAQISCAVVLVFFLLSLPRLDWHLAKRFEAILPESLSRFFNSDAPIANTAGVRTMKSRLEEDVEQLTPASGSGDRKNFGMGSSKLEVLAVQGSPSSASGNVFRYGASEVYFVGDRVVGWRDAPSDPLRLR